jgi:hypothetical protein
MANPKFICLSDRMQNGMVADIESGFKLSGRDVQPFPEDQFQARFVRQKINAGIIEAAGQAEYDEAHPEPEEADEAQQFVEAVKIASNAKPKVSERKLRAVTAAHRERIDAARRGEADDEDEEDYDEEAARREEILAEQQEDDTDDPEEQIERSATRAPAKKAAAAKKASKRSSS